MNVYAETNFVLEAALLQEYHKDCEKIVGLCGSGDLTLVIPAYSLAESYEALIRRHRERKRLKTDLDAELNQLARTDSYTGKIREFLSLLNLLTRSSEDEIARLEKVRSRVADIIPLGPEWCSAPIREDGIYPECKN